MIVEKRGKRGNKVAVIFPHYLEEAIDLLITHRQNANVDPKNEYLFPRTNFGSLSYIRGSDVLRHFAHSCGAKKPHMLTSSKLRIHLGTVTQLLNLNDGELNNLSSFMGHSIQVHNEFYKLPENTLYLAKVSKLLIALERGNLNKYKGMSLDEINFNYFEEDESDNSSKNLNNSSDEELSEISNNDKTKITTEKIKITRKKNSSITKENIGSEDPSSEEYSPAIARKTKKIQNTVREKWTFEEQNFIDNFFKTYVLLGRVPNIEDCKKCIRASNGILEKKSWKKIKYRVYNNIKKKKSM